MQLTDRAAERLKKLFPEGNPVPESTDPELAEIFANFAFGEVPAEDILGEETRNLAVLAALLGCGGAELFGKMLSAALNAGVSPVQAREVVYQAAAYLGMGRVYPFLSQMNGVFASRGIALPLVGQKRVGGKDRVTAGERTQVEIFGDGMRGFAESGPEETRHINRWLSANCFGDYYTRGGLDYRQREMITFCFLAAQGGCEPQLTSHAMANMRIGNDKKFLISVLSQCLPYVGYPRTLNALACVNAAAEKLKS